MDIKHVSSQKKAIIFDKYLCAEICIATNTDLTD